MRQMCSFGILNKNFYAQKRTVHCKKIIISLLWIYSWELCPVLAMKFKEKKWDSHVLKNLVMSFYRKSLHIFIPWKSGRKIVWFISGILHANVFFFNCNTKGNLIIKTHKSIYGENTETGDRFETHSLSTMLYVHWYDKSKHSYGIGPLGPRGTVGKPNWSSMRTTWSQRSCHRLLGALRSFKAMEGLVASGR